MHDFRDMDSALAAYAKFYDVVPLPLLLRGMQLAGIRVNLAAWSVQLATFTHVTGIAAHENCRDCVYLKLDGAPNNLLDGLPELTVAQDVVSVSIYAGQTKEVFKREKGQLLPQHYLCLRHHLDDFDMDCMEMAAIAINKIIFPAVCRNRSPLGKRVYLEGRDGRAVILGTAPPHWYRRSTSLRGLPPTRIVPALRPYHEGDGAVPALARTAGAASIPFFDEYPDGVSSRSYVEFAKVTPAGTDHAWAGVCSLPEVQEANVVVRTGFRPVFMGKGPALMNGFLAAVGEAEVVRVEREVGDVVFVVFVWWFDPGYLRYLRFRGDPTAFEMMSKALPLLPDVLEALGGGCENKLTEVELMILLDKFDASPLKTQVKDLVAAALNDSVKVPMQIAGPYPSAQSRTSAVSGALASAPWGTGMVAEGGGAAEDGGLAEGWWEATQGEADDWEVEPVELTVDSPLVDVPAPVEFVREHFRDGTLNNVAASLIRRATRIDPAFSRLPYVDRLGLIAEAGRVIGSDAWVHHLDALIRRGDFTPMLGESRADQVSRARAETNRRRVNQPKGNPGEIAGVCILCGFEFIKVPATMGIVHVAKGCISKMREGWHFVRRAAIYEVAAVFPLDSVYWRWLKELAATGRSIVMVKTQALVSFEDFIRRTYVPGRRQLLASLKGTGQHMEALFFCLNKIQTGIMRNSLPGGARVRKRRVTQLEIDASRLNGGPIVSSKDTTWELFVNEGS
ncbi:hypothetical protein HK101_000383 [Irineochytrium annulatum]|nr:hypothetical protein HK101_000383 [Irineochytrium annulatum]